MSLVREMDERDVGAVVEIWGSAFAEMTARYQPGTAPRSPAQDRRLANRIGHFLGTDPGGSFVADEGGTVVGFAQSFVREGHWVLSLLATAPGAQRRGAGRALLEAALGTTERDAPGTIQSSRDPSAMALYAGAGFSLHPSIRADGPVRRPVEGHRSVRHGGGDDLELVRTIDRAVRGAARAEDVVAMLAEPGNRLLVVEGEGYAVATDDRLVTLAARREEVAGALLRTVLAEVPAGGPVEVGWVTAGQQWAVRALVAAGVALHPSGPVMVKGMATPPCPYIPSGGYG